MATQGLPDFPSKATEARRLRANRARSAKLSPKKLAQRNAQHKREMKEQAAERKRIRAMLDAERNA